MNYPSNDINQPQDYNLADLITLQDFRGKSIVSIDNGQRIGQVEDIMVDPNSLALSAIITSQGTFLRQEIRGILVEDVQVWGIDAVLVRRSDVILAKEQLTGFDNFISANDQIRGRDVISTSGERVGELSDLLVSNDGRIQGYELGRVNAGLADKARDRNNLRLPVSTVASLGKDVLVVEMASIRQALSMPEEPVMPATGGNQDWHPFDEELDTSDIPSSHPDEPVARDRTLLEDDETLRRNQSHPDDLRRDDVHRRGDSDIR
jgi:sporulation protein YlmC with PRC-barrel domain